LKTDKVKQLVQLLNRSEGLLNSLHVKSRSRYRSDERNTDLAARYNVLRADVRRSVNDPDFDRTVPPAWCFKPFPHIPFAFLVPLLGIGLAYFLLESNEFWAVVVTALGLVIIYGIFAVSLFPASTIEQVQDRATMLHQYLQDYITLNPDLASRIQRKSEQRLERQLEYLQSYNLELEKQLAELRRRESAYLSIISQAQTSATYSLPSKSRKILLDSLQRQHTILTKNLSRLQETKAQYGLKPPLDILNAIDQTQEELKRIEATIANLKASKTGANSSP